MKTRSKRKSGGRMMLASLLVILGGAVVAPLSGYLYVGIAGAQEQQEQKAGEGNPDSGQWGSTNPRSEYWREVRRDVAGTTTDTTRGANTLITGTGQDWRRLRNGPVSTLSAYFLPLVALAIGLFYIWKGQAKIEGQRTGRTITRWTKEERFIHWATATMFIVLAITGLSLLFGRGVLIPLFGAEGFAAWASFSKLLHNYTGPLFTVGILLIIVSWIKDNIPRREDLTWFKKGGGMLGEHASAGRMNAGEKVWFWFIATAGVVVCISGLVLDFPNLIASRWAMQIANIIHAVLAIGWIGFFFGHAYIGTLGTEGALEGMTTGEVDEAWAKQHHDLWYEEIKSGQREQSQSGETGGYDTQPTSGSV